MDGTAGSIDGKNAFLARVSVKADNTLYSYISVVPTLGGSEKTVYPGPGTGYAITSIATSNYTNSLLFTVDGTYGQNADTSQDGLWKMNIDGTGVTHLFTTNNQAILNTRTRTSWSNVSRDGSMYAIETYKYNNNNNSIQEQNIFYGLLSNGKTYMVPSSGFASVIGWTI
ncbi:MAG TPA: hypothetical protein VGD98_04540 [Ktedonobacteraceae bacterium]